MPSRGAPGPCSSIRWPVILLGLILIVLNSRWIAEIENIRSYTWPSMFSLPLNVIAVLFALTLLNRALRRLAPRVALNQAELLVLYSMLAVGSVIAGWSFVPLLLAWVLAPTLLATPENRYAELVDPLLPDWLVPKDESALRSLLSGESSLWQAGHLKAWAAPLAAWSLFLLCFIGAMACISVIVRQRWADEERLTFPVVRLPFEITRPDANLLANRWLWAGLALSGGSALLSGVSRFYPWVPALPAPLFMLGESFPDPPWNALAQFGLPIRVYPWVVGFGILMPQEVLFSYWFFYWFVLVQKVVMTAAGWQVAADSPFIRKQVGGAMLALLPAIIWSGRSYLRGVWLQVKGQPGGINDSGEPISYRAAAIGIVVCVSVMLALLWAAGMSPWLGMVVLAIYFAFTITVTRARAEMGGPANEVGLLNHDLLLVGAFGAGSFRPRDLALMSLTSWWGIAYGQDPVPHQIEGFRLAQLARFTGRTMLIALVLAAVVGVPAAFANLLGPLYSMGVDKAECAFRGVLYQASGFSYTRLANWLSVGAPADPENAHQFAAMGGGFTFSLILYALRARYFWWPFHPLGFVMSGNYYTNFFWPSIFVAWAAKSLLFRYGGRKAYERSLPLFLGLILGDAVMGSVWSIYGSIRQMQVFSVWI
ncbi:MAG: DUF6785 family protein [Armatimonadota bacterium]